MTRKFIKNINQDIVYVGFPVDKLLERIGERSHKKTDFGYDVVLSDAERPDDANYDEWRRTIPTEVASRGDVNSLSPHGDELYRAVCERIRVYPMETKSLIECVSFLADLKKVLSEEVISKHPLWCGETPHLIDRSVLLERCREILARRVKNLHSGAARRRTYVGEASSPPRTDVGRHVPLSNTSELQGDDVFGGASYDFVDYLLEKICLLNPLADCRVVGDTAEWRKLPADKSLFAAQEGCGLPIGNLSSQLFSNIYLGMLDDFVKRELKVRHYGRYVDDMFIVGESKEYVKSLIEPIRAFLRERLHLELSENKTKVCDARYGVEFLGAFVKPFRTYVASRSLRHIRGHLHSVTPRMNRDRAQAVVNSSLGVLSHYDSYNVRTALSAKCRFSRVGTISEDGLRFCPSPLDWAVYRSRCKTSMPCRRGGSPRQKKVGDIPDLTRQAAASTAVDILKLPFKKGIQQ